VSKQATTGGAWEQTGNSEPLLNLADNRSRLSERLLRVDIVAKVGNRPTPKISQKLIFSRLCRCNTPQRRYEVP
jgi:hypothetical protein